jgi:hypothetical protein
MDLAVGEDKLFVQQHNTAICAKIRAIMKLKKLRLTES